MKFKKFSVKLLSVVMTLAMMLGVCAPMVAATGDDAHDHTEKKDNLNYVSLGDSMSNGYGLPGYELNSGVEDYGDKSYANLFADWLEENVANNVDHAQLAMSGIRVEDLHWLLELDYNDQEAIDLIAELIDNGWNEAKWNAKFTTGDYWTLEEICDHSRLVASYTKIVARLTADGRLEGYAPATHGNGTHRAQMVALVAKYFQENVAEADIISLAIGNGNLGVFGFGRILEAIGFSSSDTYTKYNIEAAIRECSPELQAEILNLKDELYAAVEARIGSLDANPTLKTLADIAVYIGLSMALNYAGTLEAILLANPDAEIILIPVMNTFGNSTEEVEGISLGDLMGAIVTPYNAYVAGLPTVMHFNQNETYKNAKFYYAEAASVECIVETYDDGLNDTVRDRFVESIVGEAGDPGMVWGLLGNTTYVTLDEIKAYEALDDAGKLAYAAGNADKAMSISMYLAFEKAIILGKDNPVTVESVLGLSEIMAGDPFGPIMTDFYAAAAVAGAAKLDTVATFVANGSNGMVTAKQVAAMVKGGDAAVLSAAYALVAANSGAYGLTANDVANLYTGNDLSKAYEIVAKESNGQLTADQVKFLYLGGEDAIYAYMSQQSVYSVDQLKEFYKAGVPETVKAVNSLNSASYFCLEILHKF